MSDVRGASRKADASGRKGRRVTQHRGVAALAVAALLAAACGSTVQDAVEGTAAGDAALADTALPADSQGFVAPLSVQRPGNGSALPQAAAAPPVGAAPAAVAPSEPRPAPQAAGPSSGGSVPAPSGATPPSGATTPSGGAGPGTAAPVAAQPGNAPTSSALHGVTDDDITIAFLHPEAQNEGAAAHGLQTDFADWGEVFDVMVEWVNANGGVNGRNLVAHHRTYTTAEYTQGDAFNEQLCTEFTQDHDVYAVMNHDAEALVACLAQSGVPLFSASAVAALDTQGFDQYRGFLYHTSGIDATQNAVLTAQGNVAIGHLTPDSTVAVVTFDRPSHERAAEVFEAELAHHGIAVAETVLVNYPAADFGSAAIASSVLRFNSLGVDRIAFLEQNGLLWGQFTLHAESQGYRPGYVLNPSSFAQFWRNSGQMPVSQMEGSRGVGTHTLLQIHRDSEPYPPPGRTTCRQILDAAGIAQGSDDSETTQLFVCEQIRFAKAALDRAADLSPAGLQAAVESLGRGEPALAYGSYHGPGFHTGAGTYFTFEFATDCSCYHMFGDLLDLPGIPQ